MNVNRDYTQLRAYLAAIAELSDQIRELNMEKSRLYQEADACGLPRAVVRDLARMQEAGKLPDKDIPSAYDGIIMARLLAD